MTLGRIRAWPYAHWALPAIGAVAVAIGHRELFAPVLDNGGDVASHMLAEYALALALEVGDNPFGPLSFDFGFPILRFYQSLLYLTNVSLHYVTGLDLRLVHNIIVGLCFTLSPFTYCYFFSKLRLGRLAAGAGALLAMTSVGSFGNSFEAYHGIGIATQSMGALFLPLFLGKFVGLFRRENGWPAAALCFALAFLAHAIMAVYAVLVGALYLLVAPVRVGPNLGRVALFAVFGAALVAFWALPFLEHTVEHRPVPDSITRGQAKRWWFNSVEEHEVVELALSGRLLDDPRELRSDQTGGLDQVMERVGIGVTVRTRFPFVTLLAGVGLLVALVGFRRTGHRFLAAGLAGSLLLFAGPDDFPFLQHIPLIGLVHAFRATFLVELFAFGLAGLAVHTVTRTMVALVGSFRHRRRRVFGWALTGAGAVAVIACVSEILLLARLNVRVHEPTCLEAWYDANRALPNKGYPFRVLSLERWNSYRAWLNRGGLRSACSHWGGLAPPASRLLCRQLQDHPERTDLAALAGIRYVAGRGTAAAKHLSTVDDEGDTLYERLPNGPDRRGRSNAGHYLLDSGRDHFLRPIVAHPIPVVCDDRQWVWIVDSWISRYGTRLRAPGTPLPLRVHRGELGRSRLLAVAQAALYLNEQVPSADREALAGFVERGGVVVASAEIENIVTRRIDLGRPIWWSLVTGDEGRNADQDRNRGFREEDDLAFQQIEITRLDDTGHTSQRYSFDVDVLKPIAAVLPTAAVSGWEALLDGRPLPVFPAGPDLLGMWLPAGAHRLELSWVMPTWHRATLMVSLSALILVVSALVICGVGRWWLTRSLAKTWRRSGGGLA